MVVPVPVPMGTIVSFIGGWIQQCINRQSLGNGVIAVSSHQFLDTFDILSIPNKTSDCVYVFFLHFV